MAISGSAAIGAEVLAWSGGKDRAWPDVALALFAIATDGLETVNQGWIALRHFSLNGDQTGHSAVFDPYQCFSGAISIHSDPIRSHANPWRGRQRE
jgi:hypothetical protein